MEKEYKEALEYVCDAVSDYHEHVDTKIDELAGVLGEIGVDLDEALDSNDLPKLSWVKNAKNVQLIGLGSLIGARLVHDNHMELIEHLEGYLNEKVPKGKKSEREEEESDTRPAEEEAPNYKRPPVAPKKASKSTSKSKKVKRGFYEGTLEDMPEDLRNKLIEMLGGKVG